MEIDTTYQKLPSETIDQYNARVAAYNAGKSGAPQDQPPVSLKPTGNNLLDFKNAMDWATNLAKQKRNVLSLDFMKPLSGTVAASDFGSILGNLNRASDTFAADVSKNAADIVKDSQPKYKTDQIGDTLYQYEVDAAGKIVGKPTPILSAPKSSASTETESGSFKYSKQDYSDDSRALEQSRGSDGWVDPAVYKTLYNEWIKKGGTAPDFLAKFPPTKYVNPANETLPPFLRNPNKPDDDGPLFSS